MSDENIANREYTADTGEIGSTMPGSRMAGNGEMGASMDDNPAFIAGDASDEQGNVMGAGTGRMLDVGNENTGGGTTGMGGDTDTGSRSGS